MNLRTLVFKDWGNQSARRKRFNLSGKRQKPLLKAIARQNLFFDKFGNTGQLIPLVFGHRGKYLGENANNGEIANNSSNDIP